MTATVMRVLRLAAIDTALVLDERQVQCLTFWVLELLPAHRCDIDAGPGAEIRVAEREREGLTPGLHRKFDEIAGCHWAVSAQ